jgi:peptide/nickel transport system substrate-binding protein
VYQEDLKKIGLTMVIKQMEWATFLQKVKSRDYQAATMGWSLSIDPDPYMIWHSSQVKDGLNYVNFKNKEADQLMEEARSIFDVNERAKRYHRIHEILADEQPYTFLFYSPALVAIDKRFQNAVVSPQGLGLFLHYPGQLNWWVPKQIQKYKS